MHWFRLEQLAGLAIMLFVLLDVFLTVLYARVGTGVLSARLSRLHWRVIRRLSRHFGRNSGKVLSFAAPLALVSLVGAWAILLALGAGLIVHPALGTAVRVANGPTPTDLFTALYAGASSLAFLGTGDFAPHTDPYRIFYLFASLVGIGTMTLVLNYLMQVYMGLRERNTYCLKLHLLSGQTDDAAEILAGFAAHDKFESTYTALAEIGAEGTQVKEAHHFFPILSIFRFREPPYALCAAIARTLDLTSLIKSALDDEHHGWVKESAAVTQIWRAGIMSAKLLDETQRHHGAAKHGEEPDEETRERWRRRYQAAVRRLRQAGVTTHPDEAVGAEMYASLRAEWDHRIQVLAPAMGYTMKEIDPAGADPKTTDQLQPFVRRLTAAE